MPRFESKPFDGTHPWIDPGDDWRGGNSVGAILDRTSAYGNWAGTGNRAEAENAGHVASQVAADPHYDVSTDASLMGDGRYQPIDAIDAAAMRHDSRYAQELGAGGDMWSWEGMRAVREADRELVAGVGTEMDTHGDLYSEDAEGFTRGLRGVFGGRVMGMDAIDWTTDKAGEASAGVGSFLDEASGWDSLGEAWDGVSDGAGDAASWIGDTASEAWSGITGAADTTRDLGFRGGYNTLFGLGSAAKAGAGHLWDWLTD